MLIHTIRVLMIEDNPDDAWLLKHEIENSGYTLSVERVVTADELKQALHRQPWDIILADYQLPTLDAPRALAIVRNQFPDIPFIIVSGTAREDTIVQCMRDGANDFFVKGRTTLLPHAIEREIQAAEERRRRNQAERELRDSEQRLARLFTSSPVPFSVTRIRDQKILEVNDAYVDMLGYSAEEIIGHTVKELDIWVSSEERHALTQALEGTLPVRNFEFLARTKGGDISNILLTADIIDYHGEACVLSMAIDITERKRAEESDRRRAKLLNTVGQAVILTNVDGIVEYWNEAAETLYGWRADEAIGRNIGEMVVSVSQHEYGAQIMRQVIAGHPWSGEFLVRRRDGTEFSAFVNNTPFFDRAGQVVGVIGITADISELKAVEQRLRDSEERHRVIVENIFDAVLMTDEAGRFTYISPSVSGVFDLTQDEVAQRGTVQALLGLASLALDNLANTGDTRGLDCHFRTPTRGERALHGYIRRIGIGEGTFLVICRDVTERQRAIHALRQSETRFRMITENARDLYALLDSHGNCVYASPAYRRLLGYDPQALVGRNFIDNLLNLEDWFVEDDWHSLPPKRSRLRKSDGSWLWVEGYTYPIQVSGVEHIVAVGHDLTERLQLEEKLLETERLSMELEKQKEMNELKGRFVSMVSHEFRTPLAAIQTSSDLLQRYHDRMTEERQAEHLDQIGDHVRQLTALLDEVLMLSKADSVGLAFAPQPTDVGAFVTDIAASLKHVHASERIRIHQMTPVTAALDHKLFREAVANLLTNALKYSPPDSPVDLDVDRADSHLVLRITDHGIGIPESDRAHLFDAFQRASNVGSVQGTGLGLAIVKRAIDTHKGQVFFESRLGEGTVFTIEMPLMQQEETLVS